jgi:hypothetical protein
MGDGGRIKIIQLMDRECRFKPLSHVWGDAPNL